MHGVSFNLEPCNHCIRTSRHTTSRRLADVNKPQPGMTITHRPSHARKEQRACNGYGAKGVLAEAIESEIANYRRLDGPGNTSHMTQALF